MALNRRVGELIKEVEIHPEQLRKAQYKAERLGVLNNSITNGGGNVYGFLGEIIFADLMGIESNNTMDYDMLFKGIRIEVKSKHCTSPPRPEYECSIAKYNPDQECDYYVFVRIMKDFSKAWVLGKKKKQDYFNEAFFCKKGEVDPKSTLNPPFRFSADCYNLPIRDLSPIIFPERQ